MKPPDACLNIISTKINGARFKCLKGLHEIFSPKPRSARQINQMKLTQREFIMKKICLASSLAAIFAALTTPSAAQALTVTSQPITVSLPVNSPTCTILISSPTITLPAASTSQTAGNYQTAYLPTQGLSTNPSSIPYYTSAQLNQTATISCNQANTPIASVIVVPGANANLTGPGLNSQYLIDSAPTPNRLTNVVMTPEQVSINGTPAAMSYHDPLTGLPKAYTTPFSTGSLTGSPATSTATVVWRPQFVFFDRNIVFTSPTGNSYNGVFQMKVDY